jgi:hypothetical protein
LYCVAAIVAFDRVLSKLHSYPISPLSLFDAIPGLSLCNGVPFDERLERRFRESDAWLSQKSGRATRGKDVEGTGDTRLDEASACIRDADHVP